MAHASSAQREPSMEEILASIRRIIEDSDTVKKPSAYDRRAGDGLDPVEDDEPLTLEPANSDVVSFLRADEPVEEPVADEATAPQVDVGSEAPEAAATAEDPDLPYVPVEDFELPDDFGAELEELRAELSADDQVQAQSEPEEPAQAVPETPSIFRQPLLSEQTGRQVAASFGELSDAFAASRRKSFDEMAEEMLRPMLQDWLDDNLPTLVERLVREEIERVARGGSR